MDMLMKNYHDSRKTPAFRHGVHHVSLNENEYRGTHGNLRLGRVCKTNGGNARRTKNPPALAVGSVKMIGE